MCQLQQSSMAGGGDGAVSAVAFNFLEVWCESFNIFLDTTFKWFSGTGVQWLVVVLSAGLLESSAVRGGIRLPRFTLRGCPGVLYDGFLAPLVSSSLCLWLVVGWMDGQFSTSLF